MKKPWQVWTLFFLCLLAVAVAMLWLSLKAYRLDADRETDRAETELARREAELQERISSALYRMDLKMLPLVALEAARSEDFYRGSEKREGKSLSVPASGFVQLHFEISPDSSIRSPKFSETVDPENQKNAGSNGTFLEKIEVVSKLFDFRELSKKLMKGASSSNAVSNSIASNVNQPSIAYNIPAVENFQYQLDNQAEQPGTGFSSKIDQQRSRGDQRNNSEFSQRRNSTQGFATLNRDGPTREFPPMQPIWEGENLIMARQVSFNGESIIQCCWLDWAKIKAELQTEVAEILPEVEFEALTSGTELKLGTALTTLPVQLIVNRPRMLSMLAMRSPELEKKSALLVSLFAAWSCLGLAAVASALLLHGVVRLSERRAAFVSAVTHELRTPLTTFRMYSEMLAEGMVPPEKQQQYANTLKVQADRLSHLVENVLQFARLERGPVKNVNENVTISELFERFRSRLEERAADGQMQLVISIDESITDLLFRTQPAAIEQILFNLVDNACKYAQSPSDNRIELVVGREQKAIQFSVRDFGPGIKPQDLKRLFEPFQQSATAISNASPGVGLGLALCNRMAHSLGGRLFVKPCAKGALFVLEVPLKT